jgi:transposase-like protein
MMKAQETAVSCPRCQSKSSQTKAGHTPAGSQRYRCKRCGARHTPAGKERGYDEEVRLQALTLYLEGLSLREISRLLSVNHQSVANWINDYATHLPANLPPSILEIAILDGFYTPPKKRQQQPVRPLAKESIAS